MQELVTIAQIDGRLRRLVAAVEDCRAVEADATAALRWQHMASLLGMAVLVAEQLSVDDDAWVNGDATGDEQPDATVLYLRGSTGAGAENGGPRDANA